MTLKIEIQKWKESIKKSISSEMENIKKTDIKCIENRIPADKINEFKTSGKFYEKILEYFEKEAYEELQIIERISKSLPLSICNCEESRNSKYGLNAREQVEITQNDCFKNAILISMINNGKASIIYGIAEDVSTLPRIHIWNKIGNHFYDYTWELNTKIGNKYWKIREFSIQEFLYLLRLENGKSRTKWDLNCYLMKEPDKTLVELTFKENLEIFVQKTFKPIQ